MWIDTDAGLDDALAIFIALKHLKVDGIVCSFGNSDRDQVARNVTRIVSAHCHQYNQPPPSLYLGPKSSSSSLCRKPQTTHSQWHGGDGLGDCPDLEQQLGYELLHCPLKDYEQFVKDFAADENPQLITLGPLTAAADLTRRGLRFGLCGMFGCFPQLFTTETPRIPKNYDVGNMAGFGCPRAEHNVVVDAEAADTVLRSQKVTVADWALTVRNGLSEELYQELCVSAKSTVGRFYSAISKQYWKALQGFGYEQFLICDSLAVIVVLNKRTSALVAAGVSLEDDETYGECVLEDGSNVEVVTGIEGIEDAVRSVWQ